MSEFVCGLYESFGGLSSERIIGVLRDFHVDGRVLKSLIIEKRQRGYAWYPLAALCVFRIRVLFCSELISGAEAAHKIDRMAPSGRSQRRR